MSTLIYGNCGKPSKKSLDTRLKGLMHQLNFGTFIFFNTYITLYTTL